VRRHAHGEEAASTSSGIVVAATLVLFG